jgi:hypothetical protein
MLGIWRLLSRTEAVELQSELLIPICNLVLKSTQHCLSISYLSAWPGAKAKQNALLTTLLCLSYIFNIMKEGKQFVIL